MGVCKMCKERGKTWQGDNPNCAFKDGVFSPDNWNCATANAIRDICYEGQDLPPGVGYQYCDDDKYATIKIDHLNDYDDDDSELWIGYALWVQWYKSRGGTDQMWILGDGEPRRPTEHECLRIIEAYAPSRAG